MTDALRIEVSGRLVVAREDEADIDPVAVVEAFLDSIDPGELERLALERMDMSAIDGETTMGGAVLAALRAAVRGGG